MRFLAIPFIAFFVCQTANGQPTAVELLTKSRNLLGADARVVSTPYVIKFRGERYLYSTVDGKLKGDAYEFETKVFGHTDYPQKNRTEMEMKIGKVPFRVIEVVDGDSGWYQLNDSDPVVMSKSVLQARKQRELHIDMFLGTWHFEPGQWQFSEPKSTRMQGRDAWEFEAKSSGYAPITLWFAKESNLLLRMKAKATDVALLGAPELRLETFTRDLQFSDWKKFGTRLLPGHLQIFNDGVLWKNVEPLGVTFPKEMDAKLFVMPEMKK